ncbi:hypothetical protein V1460_35320 [Streptomyces sp. SCSIO 30461]|uniref:hypothetical protein n=1 Tax=Streptomyces sp. SCSIO 30461 TaxID=3118085 RepID=UPI0030CA8DE1
MKVRRSPVGDNTGEDGGGAHNDGVLEIEESTFARDFAADEGGGIESNPSSSLYLRDSLIEGNTAGDNGGGLDLTEPASIVGTRTIDNAVTGGEATGGGVNVDLDSDEAAVTSLNTLWIAYCPIFVFSCDSMCSLSPRRSGA